MDMDSVKDVFFEECRDNIRIVENCLLNLEKDPDDMDSVNCLFRGMHTIKGSAGMFGFLDIQDFAHVCESLFDKLRNKLIPVTKELVTISLQANDHIVHLIEYAESQEPLTAEITRQGEKIISGLNIFLENDRIKENEEKELPDNNEQNYICKQQTDKLEYQIKNKYWHISLRFKESTFKDGFDPFLIIKHLKTGGEIISLVTIIESVPQLKDFDPEKCYLGFEIVYDSKKSKEEILELFGLVMDDIEIRLLPPRAALKHYLYLIEELEEPVDLIGEILVKTGALHHKELELALKIQNAQRTKQESGALLGEVLVNEKMTQTQLVEAALDKQKQIRVNEQRKKHSMRIDVDKVDQLIRQVGELVIATANLRQLAEEDTNVRLENVSTGISRLVDGIRDSTMNIRMVPIGDTFNSFKRTIRDLASSMNKEIELEIHGGETELDKTLVEKIKDPIMHLVRNSIDHGIGDAEDRKLVGKTGSGKIILNAYHESGSIVIEVIDDGKGLSRDKIISKAIQKGLCEEDDNLSDKDVWDFIFTPGFSTAQEISSVSGRGVGMDVVKKNVESMRGMIDVETKPGLGTTFRMHLPLTLAIIDGFLIRVKDLHFVIPLDMVIECIDLSAENSDDSLKKAGDFFSLREETIPFISLNELFYNERELNTEENIIIVEYARKKAGFVVNQLLGKFQTVIKPLGKLFKNMKWVSGATILGNGKIAMILDIPQLVDYVGHIKKKVEV